MKKRHLGIYLLAAGLLAAPSADAQRSKKEVKKKQATAVKQPSKSTLKPKPAPITVTRNSSDDTTIKSTTLEVYQVYKPEVKVAPKPIFTPTLPPPETNIVPQEYNVPQQALYYTYRSVPLRPLALGKDTAALSMQNYIKAGGGNLSSIYGDLGIGSLRGNNWETAIHAQHISQKGDLQGQRFWHTGVDATGVLHSNGHEWTAAVDGDYRRYGLYGYDHDAFTYTEEDLRRTYTSINAKVGVKNEEVGILGLDYDPSLRVNYFSSNNSVRETTIDIDVPVAKKIDTNLTIELGIHGLFTKHSSDRIDDNNNIFQLTPGFIFRRDGFTGHLGLNPTFGRNGNSYLLPDITASYKTSPKFEVLAGWQAQLVQNTFQQLALKNPFYSLLNPIQQSRNDEVFVAANAGIGHHLSIGARVSWWEFHSLPMFTNFEGTTDTRLFVTSIDPRVNAISLQANARYELANSFSIGLSGAFYGFYHKTEDHVWSEPSVRFKGDVQWNILKDLQFNAYLSALGGMYGRDNLGATQKMDNILDIGAGAEYQLVPRLSLWLNVSNLLNRPNQRWYGYEAFGINVYGGLRFRF